MSSAKRDRKLIESRRRRAARLFSKGFSQAEIARRCGVSRPTALRWYRAWEKSGKKGLEPGYAGRPKRLSDSELKKVEKGLLRGPQAHGWSTELWTLERVAELIKRMTGVRYHKGHVWRVLRSLGWSLQRPTTRARERDEQAILEWKKRDWPRLKKRQGLGGRLSS